MRKFSKSFSQLGFYVNYLIWNRSKGDTLSENETSVLDGGGYGGKHLALLYPAWVFLVFIKALRTNSSCKRLYFAVDFDAALPIYLASFFNRNVKYVYDVHDDFAMRYNFPAVIKKLVHEIDLRVRWGALATIHVHPSRVDVRDKNFFVIENYPEDFDLNTGTNLLTKKNERRTFAVIGLLSEARGIRSIAQFAANHPRVSFVVAGEIIDDDARSFCALENVQFLGYLPQETLFRQISDVSAIFSLYKPDSEINVLAASNKLYDAMMLGLPIITNFHIRIAEYVLDFELGFVVDFNYNETWDILLDCERSKLEEYGKNGRALFELEFSNRKWIPEPLERLIIREAKSK